MRRFRWQINLRQVLFAVTIVCTLFGWYGHRVSRHFSRLDLIHEIQSVGGNVTVTGTNSWWPSFWTERIEVITLPYEAFHPFEPERLNAFSGFDIHPLPEQLPDGKPRYSSMWGDPKPVGKGPNWPDSPVVLLPNE